ncbi:MAG: glycosyltransferase, partial [Alphaproteobacteria bacterium]|nr:glycosyltransferase [Alphaproteobacteria bacterium]
MVTDAATFAGGPLARLKAGGRLAGGVAEAARLLGRVRPRAVIGFGGYPSAPAMTAAVLRRIPTLIHDSNAILGRTNRLLAPFVDLTALGLPAPAGTGAGAKTRARLVGNPVRDAVAARARAPYTPPAPDAPIELLVFGGSQGARIFGEVVPAAIAALPEGLRRRLR